MFGDDLSDDLQALSIATAKRSGKGEKKFTVLVNIKKKKIDPGVEGNLFCFFGFFANHLNGITTMVCNYALRVCMWGRAQMWIFGEAIASCGDVWDFY